jgi:hypothetical protein
MTGGSIIYPLSSALSSIAHHTTLHYRRRLITCSTTSLDPACQQLLRHHYTTRSTPSRPVTRQWPRASDGGLTLAPPADGMPDDASYLLCTEDATAAFFDAAAVGYTAVDDDNDECCSVGEESASIAELIGGEAENSPRSDYPDRLRSRSIDPAARAESVAWILKVTTHLAKL